MPLHFRRSIIYSWKNGSEFQFLEVIGSLVTFCSLNPDFPHHLWFPLFSFISSSNSHLHLFHCLTWFNAYITAHKRPKQGSSLGSLLLWATWGHYPSLHLHLPRFILINPVHFCHLHEDGNSMNWHWGGCHLIYRVERGKQKPKPTHLSANPKLPNLNSALALIWHMRLEPTQDLFWTECFVQYCADSVLGVRS